MERCPNDSVIIINIMMTLWFVRRCTVCKCVSHQTNFMYVCAPPAAAEAAGSVVCRNGQSDDSDLSQEKS